MIEPQWKTTTNSGLAEQLQKQNDEVRGTAKDNIMMSHLKYKKYYNRKASAASLKINDFRCILSPKADSDSTKFEFENCIWTGQYFVIKVLSNNNYTIKKTGTRYSQMLQVIQIRPYVSEQRIPEVTVRSNEYLPIRDVKKLLNEWYATSRIMNFGNQLEIAAMTEAMVTTEPTETQKTVTQQNDTPDDVAPLSPDFSNATTDVWANPYIRRPQLIENPT